MSSEPEERELMPGVFVTDFRNASSMATADTANADARQRSQQQRQSQSSEQQAKRKHEDEGDDNDDDESIAAASSASSSAALPSRPANSALPADIPTDVETLELELATLETNLGQLVRSNAELQAELLSDPGEQIYIDAIAENRQAMMRRSERITAIRKQLQILAPHRLQAANAPPVGAHAAEAEQNPPAAADGAAEEPEGGLFL